MDLITVKQPFEIQASEVVVEGASAPDYPLQKKRHTLEYLRTIYASAPPHQYLQAVFRVRSLIAYAIHQFSRRMTLSMFIRR
jgi:asparaginyl-tRNA synthetase